MIELIKKKMIIHYRTICILSSKNNGETYSKDHHPPRPALILSSFFFTSHIPIKAVLSYIIITDCGTSQILERQSMSSTNQGSIIVQKRRPTDCTQTRAA